MRAGRTAETRPLAARESVMCVLLRGVAQQGVEAALLPGVETCVERRRGLGEFLDFGGTRRQRLRMTMQRANGVVLAGAMFGGSMFRASVFGGRVLAPFGDARGVGPAIVANRGFKLRPIFFLLGRELQPGFQPGDARIGECAQILGGDCGAGRRKCRLLRSRHGDERRRQQGESRGGENMLLHGTLAFVIEAMRKQLRRAPLCAT